MVRLTWVVDDIASRPLWAEHGYAMWIAAPGGQVLLDTGGSGDVLLHNLGVLGLDPQRLDALVLSHGHDDHTGGLEALLSHLRPGTPVFAHPTLFTQRYSTKSGKLRARGLRVSQGDLPGHVVFSFNAGPVEVVPGVWTTGEVQPRPDPEGRSPHHFVKLGDAMVADPYADDLSLVVQVAGDRMLLLCGCCHAGLLNTLAQARRVRQEPIVAVAGGVHLAGASDDVIDKTVSTLGTMDSLRILWLGHCSGQEILEAARADLSDVLVRQGSAGQHLVMDAGEVVCE